ncbi:MAG: D-alanine--D-alanine ligase [Bdellovibrionales bacterium]|nr:D-alanine--D-alanine ligase [Bdellovibrionales bacterium]
MTNVTGKTVVGILYGGRSSEHEVSLRSAASVFNRLDRKIFIPKTIYIDKEGTFHWAEVPDSFANSGEVSLPKAMQAPQVVLLPRPHKDQNGRSKGVFTFIDSAHSGRMESVDVLIPMVHGKNCEDGTLQGLFESAEVPYTGSGVLGSAIGMDKEITKRLAHEAGIPIVPYRTARSFDPMPKLELLLNDVEKSFGFPVFVKAAREGSSVGVFKVKHRADFLPKLKEAFQFDSKVLIEKAIPAREIEFSVLQSADRSKAPLVSIPAEIIPTHEFYTYDAKYNDENGAIFKLPAEISETLTRDLTRMVEKIFTSLDLEGYARIDLFLDRENGAFYLNEVNTLPGFTSISMFPKLFELSGIPYTDLLTKLIELALLRYQK